MLARKLLFCSTSIAARPLNLLGTELIRDLGALFQKLIARRSRSTNLFFGFDEL
jgi:hypothetical protein